MITLAFYKGGAHSLAGKLARAAILTFTRGPYWHVEMVIGPAAYGVTLESVSVSLAWLRVAPTMTHFNPESWELVPVPVEEDEVRRFVERMMGRRYDYLGIALTHIFALNRHARERSFCSKFCAEALGFENAHRVSPQLLRDMVRWKYGV